MKKQLHKIVAILLLAFSLVAISQMAVHAQEKTNVSLLKTSEESYIIYVEDTINTEFLFCYSENTDELANLTFSASGIDSNESNVAYMDKNLAQSFENGKANMWVKVEEELTNYEIDLSQAVTSEEILFVNSFSAFNLFISDWIALACCLRLAMSLFSLSLSIAAV